MAMLAVLTMLRAGATPTTLDYRVTGVQLEVSPAALAVPKGIGGALHRMRLRPSRVQGWTTQSSSKHLDLVAGIGVEQAVIGGTLRLARLHRRVGADGETVAGRDRRNAVNKRLLTDGRLL